MQLKQVNDSHCSAMASKWYAQGHLFAASAVTQNHLFWMYVQTIQYAALCLLQRCSNKINDIFNFGVCPSVE